MTGFETRINNSGLLETLDSEGRPLIIGGRYFFEGRRIAVRRENVYEGGGAVEPFTIIDYYDGGQKRSFRVDVVYGRRKKTIYKSELEPIKEEKA